MADEPRARQRATVRRAAIESLCAAESEGRFVDEVIAARMGEFAPNDRRLLQEIVFGTTRHRNTLDALFSPYVKLAPEEQRPPIRWALRSGAYQIAYLQRVPAHAAVDQTVEALKGLEGVKRSDAGFVNALLHRVSGDVVRKTREGPREPDDPNVLPVRGGFCHLRRPLLPLARTEKVAHLALKFSHPEWLVARWLARFGEEELRRLLEANNATPRVTARITSRAPSREVLVEALEAEGMEVVPVEGRDDVVILARGGDLGASTPLADGWFMVQDSTAMAIGGVLDPPSGARVLDLCSAPGGKAAQLLERLGETGRLVAADRSADRLRIVEENLRRIGGPFETREVPVDPAAIDLGESFTHVLIDAPCSNTGVLARRPEARWRLREKDLASLTALQEGLLEAAWRHLEPGGRLVYATCAIEPEENEERVAGLIAAHPEMEELRSQLFLPHRHEGDGGYYALLLRRRESPAAGSGDPRLPR